MKQTIKHTFEPKVRPWRRTAALAVLLAVAVLLLLSLVPLMPQGDNERVATGSTTVQAASRDIYNIEQPLVISQSPRLTLERGRLTEAPSVKGDTTRRLQLDGPVFRLDLGRPLTAPPGGHEHRSISSPFAAQLTALGFDQVNIKSGTLIIVTADQAEHKITAFDAAVVQSARDGLTGSGSFTFRDERLTFDTSIGESGVLPAPTRGNPANAFRRPFRATLRSGRLGEAGVNGHLISDSGVSLAGIANIRFPSPAAVLHWFGFAVEPMAALQDIAAAGTLLWRDGLVALDNASVTFDSQPTATGALRIQRRGARPMIEGTLAFSEFDLSRYAPKESRATVWETLAKLPLASTGLRGIDADLRVSATKVLVNGQALGRAAAAFSLADNVLNIDVAEAELGPDRIRMRTTSDLSPTIPRVSSRGRLELADAQALAMAMTGAPLLSGGVIVNFDLQSNGFSVDDILRSNTDGHVTLSTSKAARLGIDVFALQPAQPLPNAAPGRSPLLATAPLTIDEFEARVDLSKNEATLDVKRLKSGARSAIITGRMGLRSGQIDAKIERRQSDPKTASKATTKALSPSPIWVRGTWAVPVLSPFEVDPPRP